MSLAITCSPEFTFVLSVDSTPKVGFEGPRISLVEVIWDEMATGRPWGFDQVFMFDG